MKDVAKATFYGADEVVIHHKNNVLDLGHHPVCAS
jgi:hypothetical protein